MQQKFSRALLEEIRNLMRSDQVPRARKLLSQLAAAKVPREHAARVAFLARSMGLRDRSARLLFPIVRGRNRTMGPATDEEKAEYAMTISLLGAATEGLQLLSEIDHRKLPRVDRFMAMSYFRIWDWNSAKPHLERLLANPDLTESDHLFAEFFLAAALVHGTPTNFARADELLEKLREKTSPRHFPTLHSDAYNMLMQSAYFQKRWAAARKYLAQMEKYAELTSDPLWVRYLLEIWDCNIQLGSGQGDREAALKRMRQASAGAFNDRRWELSRVCAYYEAIQSRDETRVQHLYFGSPYAGVREKLLTMLGRDASSMPAHYDLRIGGRDSKTRILVEAANGRNTVSEAFLKEDQLQCRILNALVADFYRRPNATEIHSVVYPGEFFNPTSSPVRVRQGLKRLRRWLVEAKLPLEVCEERKVYFLDAPAQAVSLRVALPGQSTAESKAPARLLHLVDQLRKKHSSRPFSAAEAEATLGLARWATVNHLREAEKHGLVEKQGRGPATRYALVGSSAPSSGK